MAAGYSKIYWFRGGMPEWRDKRLPVEGTAAAGLAKVRAARRRSPPAGRSSPRADRSCRNAAGPSGPRWALAAQVDHSLGLLAVEPQPAVDALVAEVDDAAEHAGVDLLLARARADDAHRDRDPAHADASGSRRRTRVRVGAGGGPGLGGGIGRPARRLRGGRRLRR